MAIKVYCDDAGFTGDNLLQTEQPFFGYAAVAIDPDEAAALIAELQSRFGILSSEIKGRFLYKRDDALAVISWLLEKLGNRASVAVSDKLYSLACKFFEYVFEPVLMPNSLFFYERGFHLHVANIIWAHLLQGDLETAQIASRFEDLLRRQEGAPQAYFEAREGAREGNAIATIQRFAEACRPTIEEELAGLADESGRIRWVLDLSFSSAKSVLCTLGERFGQLDVMFDDSKPLASYRDFFDNFIGRTEIPYMKFRGRNAPMIFNLAKPVEFGSSAAEPGLQIADLLASFSALASRDRRTSRGAEIFAACLPWFNDDSVWPDLDQLRVDRKENFLNTILLIELATRAEAGADILEGIADFCDFISMRFDVDPPRELQAARS